MLIKQLVQFKQVNVIYSRLGIDVWLSDSVDLLCAAELTAKCSIY